MPYQQLLLDAKKIYQKASPFPNLGVRDDTFHFVQSFEINNKAINHFLILFDRCMFYQTTMVEVTKSYSFFFIAQMTL